MSEGSKGKGTKLPNFKFKLTTPRQGYQFPQSETSTEEHQASSENTQRPPLQKSSSSNPHLHHSSSSLLTISKMYNQKQQTTAPVHQTSNLSPGIDASSFRGSTKPKPSHFDLKNKKLHKRVLSSSSLNDYFSTASKSVDNHTPSSISEESKTPKLPNFKRVDTSPTSPALNQPHSPGTTPLKIIEPAERIEGGAQSNLGFAALSSSKIFERRRAREQQEIEDINDCLLASNDDILMMPSDEENEEKIKLLYNEKLSKLKQENQSEDRGGATFFNSDSEDSDDVISVHSKKDQHSPQEYYSAPDITISSPAKSHQEKPLHHEEYDDEDNEDNVKNDNSGFSSDKTFPSVSDHIAAYDPRSEVAKHQPQDRRPSDDSKSSRGARKNSMTSTTLSLNSQGEHKYQGFKNIFKRFVLDEEDEDLERLQEKENETPEDPTDGGGFFQRMMGIASGGGLVPGATTDENNRPQPSDEENQMIQADQGIQLQQMDPQIFQREAQDILQAHAGKLPSRRNAAVGNDEAPNGIFPATYVYDTSDETTLKGSNGSFDDSFTAPNPDLYLRDQDYEPVQLDDGESSYIAPPDRVRGGVLSSLLRLYQNPIEASRSRTSLMSSELSPTPSAITTPINEEEEFDFDQSFKNKPTIGSRLKSFASNTAHSVAHPGKKKVAIDDSNLQEQQEMIASHKTSNSFIDASTLAESEMANFLGKKSKSFTNLPSFAKNRPKQKKPSASQRLKVKREQAAARITVHIADILQRQRFILRMCKALMLYGAPTHRLEEYLTMTARVLEIDGQFIYFPGCMIVSFGDATTRTSEVQLVRAAQGLNLYKLHRVHRIYKKVIHDLIGVEEASTQLDELLAQNPVFPPWACVLLYGFSSATVTPFAFGGGWVNLPISFGIGICVAVLQFYVAPRSNLYSNVFEVAASIVVSFLGRALGSISGANICFGAIVQGSLALILPGYIILCGSLELQSRNIVAGAVRMFYAIIYSLFLGFGITLGAALYGWIDKNATSEATCDIKLDPKWNILFVPTFTLGLCLINQARLFQIPIMLFISCVGYIVNYFSAKHFSNSTEFTAALGAFVIGIMGNLYSRIWKGLAVSAMLPAIFVQVPGSIASQNSLLAGLQNANRLTNSTTVSGGDTNSLGFGVTMVQIAIGISVGLFASTIFVYPFGKKQTSIFTL